MNETTTIEWAERGDTHYFVCETLSATAYKGPNEYGDWVWHCEIVCHENGSDIDGGYRTFWGFDGVEEWVAEMLLENGSAS
jgi:hypothetical protein